MRCNPINFPRRGGNEMRNCGNYVVQNDCICSFRLSLSCLAITPIHAELKRNRKRHQITVTKLTRRQASTFKVESPWFVVSLSCTLHRRITNVNLIGEPNTKMGKPKIEIVQTARLQIGYPQVK